MLALEKDVAEMKHPEEEPDPWVSVSDPKDGSSVAGAKPDAIKEMDETFVLESYKGSKLGDGFWRKPRKHGAKAQKPGISQEQVCICASVDRDGNAYAKTVNRASPTVEELKEVFAGRLTPGTLAVCDGLKAYKPLCKDAGCTMVDVKKVSEEESALINLNSVNGFHSLIKRVLRDYCGVATKYQNRYNALFVAMYKLTPQRECDIIRRLLTISTDSCNSTNVDVKRKNLLDLGYIT